MPSPARRTLLACGNMQPVTIYRRVVVMGSDPWSGQNNQKCYVDVNNQIVQIKQGFGSVIIRGNSGIGDCCHNGNRQQRITGCCFDESYWLSHIKIEVSALYFACTVRVVHGGDKARPMEVLL